jgi:hypothetical protein
MTLEQLKRQQREARKMFKRLAKLYPKAFDSKGKPIVATLKLPSF